MLEELLFFYWTSDDPDDPDKASAHPRRLDQTQMRSKNPWFDLLAGCYKFVYPLSETGTFIQDSGYTYFQRNYIAIYNFVIFRNDP